jgi:hypothetical protein
MVTQTTTTTAISLGTLAMAAAAAVLLPAAPARADRGGGEGTQALSALVPRDGTGWTNGGATMVPLGGGKYRLEYDTLLAGPGAGHPTAAVIVGNANGNPIIEYPSAATPRR